MSLPKTYQGPLLAIELVAAPAIVNHQTSTSAASITVVEARETAHMSLVQQASSSKSLKVIIYMFSRCTHVAL